jgi:hypothetical protein
MPAKNLSSVMPVYTTSDPVENMVLRRGVEAVIWGMPAVNFDRMVQAARRDAKAEPNEIVYWSRLSDWKNQTLTPNPDSIYLMPFINTKTVGPMVLEVPAAHEGVINGNICDAWQSALQDVGPSGFDQGRGGKYAILPPGYTGKVPAGFITVQSDTYQVFALMRSIPRSSSEADIDRAVAYGKQIRLYPLSEAASPAPTMFVDAADVVFDATIPYDVRFFESLSRFIQIEPWLSRDKVMINQLKSMGIEKGKPFDPDPATRQILAEAAVEAQVLLDARLEAAFSNPFYENTRWALPASRELSEGNANFFMDPNSYPIDERGMVYSLGFISIKHLGEGQFYLMTIGDKRGRPLEGSRSYRLSIPPDVPVRQYWSVVAYDRTTHTLFRNTTRTSRSSLDPELQTNPDGSVDIYLGAKVLVGKESNWIPTPAGGTFELLFRFYGPDKALFDKTWKLPDIERIA